MNTVVVVESPAKAKTIEKYLGKDYTVLASYGHVRDLPPKNGSVDPDNDFAMSWEVEGRGETQVRNIARAVKGADRLLLATDPDREGEAISWHVHDELKNRGILRGVEVARIAFNEITKKAIQEAIANPRQVDQDLVDAYLARRALDYLVGFTLSPVLWRKLPGAKSAGRVQSVALRLICEREEEIERFRAEEYWTIDGAFKTQQGDTALANLRILHAKKLEKFTLNNEAAAHAAVKAVAPPPYRVASVEKKNVKRHPSPPFMTSTLQMEASRKLGLSASQTMRLAQQLYEGVDIGGETVGLITYMRTDGITLAGEAIASIRGVISRLYTDKYVPDSPRAYKSKLKNAQEAHEAIRPTDMGRLPHQLKAYLSPDQLKVYELIWKRTIACQMESASLDRTTAEFTSTDNQHSFTATGSVVVFDGFLKVYFESSDDMPDDGEDNRRLPPLNEGETLTLTEVKPEQHFTQPPPRYTEASLVKKMEELGIGRPSTYASIMQVLKDREYVVLEKKRFIPQERGRLVTTFLTAFFDHYVQYNFTADLETELDEVSDGKAKWKDVLAKFWFGFRDACESTQNLKFAEVIDVLDARLEPVLFPVPADGSAPARNPRQCTACGTGRLSLKLGKFGAFIGCSNYPDCKYTKPLQSAFAEAGAAGEGGADVQDLGIEPITGGKIMLKKGIYGAYLEAAYPDATTTGAKPRRATLPKGMDASKLTHESAVRLLSLPRDIGAYPDTGEMITAGVGPWGPYLKMSSTYARVGKEDDILTMGLNRAVDLMAAGIERAAKNRRDVGMHPHTKKAIIVQKKGFKWLIIMGKAVVPLPKESKPEELTLERAVELLSTVADKADKPEKKSGAAAKRKPRAAGGDADTGAAKKPAARKAPAKPRARKPTAN
jgi:DNA topoisomerase-1